MDFHDQSMKTAYRCGAYQAIAEMMSDAIRRLEAAEADSWEADWAMRNLVSLAAQLEETQEKFKKEVDTVAE